jgi:hypothetical protein
MRYTIHGFLNTGGHFDGYKPGDRLVYGGTVTVDAPTDHSALDKAYAVGNRMERDALGLAWAPFSRSISVGDVLVVEANDSLPKPGAWAVANFGFEGLPNDTALNLGDYTYKIERLGPAGAPRVEAEF